MGNKESIQKGERHSNTESSHETLLQTPWRSFGKDDVFNEVNANKLLTNINENSVKLSQINKINILLIGPIKAGKSSFLNTVASIDKGEIAQITNTGGVGNSMTKKLKKFIAKQRLRNFNIYDTMGVEERDLNGLNIKDVMSVVNGNVPPNYQFNEATPIGKDNSMFKERPTLQERIHCVVFVVDSNVVGNDNISDAVKRKIRSLQDALDSEDIPKIVLLTKIDVLCEEVEKDIAKTYRSPKVKNAVEVAKELFNIPVQSIFPVKNYSEEVAIESNKEILILLALKQMIRFATHFLDELCEEEEEQKQRLSEENTLDSVHL